MPLIVLGSKAFDVGPFIHEMNTKCDTANRVDINIKNVFRPFSYRKEVLHLNIYGINEKYMCVISTNLISISTSCSCTQYARTRSNITQLCQVRFMLVLNIHFYLYWYYFLP